MPYKYNVKIDFLEDWTNHLKRKLKELGYNASKKGFDVCFTYFNLKRRLIEPIKRKVVISKDFKCPKNLEFGFNQLREKILNGEDIRPYLGKEILDIDYHDDLLNDWGIHHLHLGTKTEKRTGFIDRTGPLLFVRFDKEYAYFINIYEHGAWTKQEMIKILHNNWPETITQFRMIGVDSLEFKQTDSQYKKIRDKHITTFVEVEKGAVYFPIGMGYMSSGHSTQVIKDCDYYFNLFREYEKYVKSNIVQIVGEIDKYGIRKSSQLHFILWLEQGTVFAYELFSNAKIELGGY